MVGTTCSCVALRELLLPLIPRRFGSTLDLFFFGPESRAVITFPLSQLAQSPFRPLGERVEVPDNLSERVDHQVYDDDADNVHEEAGLDLERKAACFSHIS